jgi:hypothetical protein
MKGKLHLITGFAFLLVTFFNLIVWGGVKDIPGVGGKIRETAQLQAPLVITYMFLGEQLDHAVPALGRFGTDYATQAFEPALQRVRDDPNLAVVALFQSPGASTIRIMFWLSPILLLLFFVFWARRPRKISMMGGR